MKSHVKRLAARRLLRQQLLDAVLADELDAGLGEHGHVLRRDVLDRREQLDRAGGRGPSARRLGDRRARAREVLAHHLAARRSCGSSPM